MNFNKLLLFLIITISLNADNIDDIIKNIPKNTPNYTLDIALSHKIKNLKFKTIQINNKIKTQQEFINSFNKIVSIQKDYNELPNKINGLETKIYILKDNNDPTSKIQYIYYKKLLNIYNKKLLYYDNELENIKNLLFSQVNSIKFNFKSATYWQNLLKTNKHEFEKLKINLQKWELLEDKNNIKINQEYIKKNAKNKKNIYKNLLQQQLTVWFISLKNKNKDAFDIDNEILVYSKHIGNYKELSQIINDFEKYIFGNKILLYGAKTELKFTLEKILNFINYPLFHIGDRTITPLNFVIFIFILFFGWFIGKYYKKFIYKLRYNENISYSTATLLANMGYYAILIFSFLFALKVVGLDLSSLAIIAGALSVGIGFGLQNIVSNFVSGIILMFERTIKVGDYIQIDDNTRGEILDISMRSTIVRTNDNINLIIPNQSFIQNNVINWTLGDDIVRFRVPFGVAYGNNIDKIQQVVLEALHKSKIPYIKEHKHFAVHSDVIFMEMADSSLNFELFVWVKDDYARRPRRTRSIFLKMIYNALNDANITIPFPQQDLYIKEIQPIEIKIKK